MAECKSTGNFDCNQVDRLFELAKNLKCDFIALSCLSKEKSKEVTEIIKYIEKKRVDMPVFVFAANTLFNPSSVRFEEYFEYFRKKYLSGPILVGQNK